MLDDEIHQQIAQIARTYKLLECAECATAIKQWLKANQINGIHLKLKLLGRGLFKDDQPIRFTPKNPGKTWNVYW